MFFNPRLPTFAEVAEKFVAGITSLVSNSPILVSFLWSLIKSLGVFPTRLVIPATNFSATFAKIGYLGVKNIPEKNETKAILTPKPLIKDHKKNVKYG